MSKPRQPLRFSLILMVDGEFNSLEDAEAICEAVDAAEAELAEVGNVKRVADRFYLEGSKVGKGEVNASATTAPPATQTAVVVTSEPVQDEKMAVKMS